VVVWRQCCEVFDCLGLACVISDKVLCVHGGLSPSVEKLDQIQAINRRREVPHDGRPFTQLSCIILITSPPPCLGPFCDLLWSDPDESVVRYAVSARGAGYLFGWDAVERFCHTNSIDLIARAHQLVMEGFKWHFNGRVVTVWSAPNYCYRCGNVASIMKLDEEMQPTFEVFKSPSMVSCFGIPGWLL
jgi:diadenosine tetraphosphatase ApaH/serine/threonine PP2A family protein phosphatase